MNIGISGAVFGHRSILKEAGVCNNDVGAIRPLTLKHSLIQALLVSPRDIIDTGNPRRYEWMVHRIKSGSCLIAYNPPLFQGQKDAFMLLRCIARAKENELILQFLQHT